MFGFLSSLIKGLIVAFIAGVIAIVGVFAHKTTPPIFAISNSSIATTSNPLPSSQASQSSSSPTTTIASDATPCNGVSYSACPAGQDFVCPANKKRRTADCRHHRTPTQPRLSRRIPTRQVLRYFSRLVVKIRQSQAQQRPRRYLRATPFHPKYR